MWVEVGSHRVLWTRLQSLQARIYKSISSYARSFYLERKAARCEPLSSSECEIQFILDVNLPRTRQNYRAQHSATTSDYLLKECTRKITVDPDEQFLLRSSVKFAA